MEQHGVEPGCQELHIAPATYYWQRKRQQNPELRSVRPRRDEQLSREIERVYDENKRLRFAISIRGSSVVLPKLLSNKLGVVQMKTLSVHSEMAKAFGYMLKQWDALNVFCGDGWVEIDNNIAENALRGVALGRKNWLFAGSDKGGEAAAIIYSLLGTCKLNGVESEGWMREVIAKINDWPSNQVHELLPWKLQPVK